jgi:hypothetical protein
VGSKDIGHESVPILESHSKEATGQQLEPTKPPDEDSRTEDASELDAQELVAEEEHTAVEVVVEVVSKTNKQEDGALRHQDKAIRKPSALETKTSIGVRNAGVGRQRMEPRVTQHHCVAVRLPITADCMLTTTLGTMSQHGQFHSPMEPMRCGGG